MTHGPTVTASVAPVAVRRLYLANLALLATHQVDAAYWHEWDVFGVPGGLPVFLVFNLGAVALLAVGLVRIAEGARTSRAWSLLCAGVGLFTVALHALFLFLDREAFWAPASLAVLAGILATSIGQLLRLPPAVIPSVSPDARSGR